MDDESTMKPDFGHDKGDLEYTPTASVPQRRQLQHQMGDESNMKPDFGHDKGGLYYTPTASAPFASRNEPGKMDPAVIQD